MLDTVNGMAKRSQYSSGGQLVYASDARTSKLSDYVYLGGSLVAIREQSTAGGAFTNKYQHTDALGSPVAVTDQARATIETSEYEPYGKMANRADKDGPGFTGHVQDAATGMTYMQQRYYDPGLGLFLSIDPISARQNYNEQFNRYRYANGNPYVFKDTDGRCANRYSDGTCQVTVEAQTGAAGIAAGKQLEVVLNRFDGRINALADNSKFEIKDRSGGKIGALTGSEIKKVWEWHGIQYNK